MAKLTDTYNLTKKAQFTHNNQKYNEVASIADGNCVFNSFALGLIDLIKQERLMSEANMPQLAAFASWVASENCLAVLKARSEEYLSEDGNYSDVEPALTAFIDFVERSENLTFSELSEYIRTHSEDRFAIAALHVALAPALRHIGVQRYIDSLREIGADDFLVDAENLRQDKVHAGQEIIPHLAQTFGVNIALYIREEEGKVSSNSTDANHVAGAPAVSLLFDKDHWNYVIPAKQKNGVAILPCRADNDFDVESDQEEEVSQEAAPSYCMYFKCRFFTSQISKCLPLVSSRSQQSSGNEIPLDVRMLDI